MKGMRLSGKAFQDGRIVPLRTAVVSALDRGFLFGDGIYETFRTYKGKPFRMNDHLARLAQSARLVSIRLPFSSSYLGRAVKRLVAVNKLSEARIRIVVTRGKSFPLLSPPRRAEPTVFMYGISLPPKPSALSPAVKLVVSRFSACPNRAPDPRAKTLGLLGSISAHLEADRMGAQDSLTLNCRGCLTEGVSSNLFFVKGERVMTPSQSCGILPGVTRSLVIRSAKRLGLDVREGCFKPADLMRADEAFLTSSIAEIRPVSGIGSRRFQCPGLVTRALAEAYRAWVRHELGI